VDDALVDVRGTRFAAWLTAVVLAVVLLTSSTLLVALQTGVFLLGAVFGLRAAPYGVVFRQLVRPLLRPPAEVEPEAPPRFAQAVGAVFALVATVGFAVGWTALGMVATAFALAAAFLNAAFGFCLGCELYLFALRASRSRGTRSATSTSVSTSAATTSNDEGVSL
jgi:hypothetical protein